MTVVLEMKMPETCEDCPFVYITEGAYNNTCNFPDSKITSEEVTKHLFLDVPYECPLKKFKEVKNEI